MRILPGKIPLGVAVTVPFVALIVLAVGLAGYLSFRNGHQAVNDAADQVRAEISRHIQDRLSWFLMVPYQINQINSDAIARGLVDVHDAKVLERRFWGQVQAFPSVTSIYFGNAAGGLADSGRELATDSKYVMRSEGFRSGTMEKWAVDLQGNAMNVIATIPNFDARTRPWYIQAVEKGGPAWSPIYVLSTGQDMAIAASRPVVDPDGTLLGVVSVDIFLSHISEFLKGLKVGENGQCFVMERSGLLVASSTNDMSFTGDAGSEPRRRVTPSECRSPVARLAAAALIARFGDYRRIEAVQNLGFEVGGTRYSLKISPVQDPWGLDWLACVVICEADFMSAIEANNRQTVLLMAGTLLLTVMIGLGGARRITRSISGLHLAAQDLAKGQWPQTEGMDSAIREISGLKHSFALMATQLRHTVEKLRHEVAVSRKAQEALREGEERWQFALEGAGDGVWDWNAQTDEVFFSHQWKAMLGFEDHEIGNTLSEWDKRVHPEDRAHVYAEIDKHFAGQTPVYMSEHRVQCKDGTYKWILDRGKVIRWTQDDKPLRVIGTHTDISEGKRNQAMLQAERDMAAAWGAATNLEERLEICLKTAIQVSSMDGGGFYAMDETDGSLALRVHQGLSEGFVTKVSRYAEGSGNARVVQQGAPVYFKTEDLSGANRDVLLSEGIKGLCVLPLVFEGRAVGSLNIASRSMDTIPEHARTALERIGRYATSFVAQEMEEERTRQSQQDLNTLFNTIQDMLFILDREGKIIHHNRVATDKLGYPADQLMGKSVLFVHPEDRHAEVSAIIASILAGETDTYAIPVKARDGRLIPVETKAVPGHWKGRKSIIGICRDISERVKLEHRIRQAEKAESLGRMAGAIAHHFNNQLQGVTGNLELAMFNLRPGSATVRNLNEAMKAARRAAEVSGLMLTYLGQTVSERGPIDLSEACRLSLFLIEAAMSKNVLLATDLPTPGPTVRGDANQIQEVVTGLVTNAWEAMDENGGTVHVAVKTVAAKDIPAMHRFPMEWGPEADAYACIEVKDNGSGISEQNMEKLFDPFFSTKFTGRGMGLSVAVGIVRAHGGCIAVESRCEAKSREQGALKKDNGRQETGVGSQNGGTLGALASLRENRVGSVFRVFLPLCAEEIASSIQKAVWVPEMKGGGTVLLVEDTEQVRDLGARMLEFLGFKVVAAKDGVEGVEIFREHQNEIRFVLSDLTMPRMDGWATIAALRQIKPNIPIILASGYDEASVLSGEHAERPTSFLAKPYTLEDLREAIGKIVAPQMGPDPPG